MPRYSLTRAVPGLGQVGDREPAVDQLLLELESHDDVERVRRLVGLDPDQRRHDVVDGAEQAAGIDLAWRPAEAIGNPFGEDSAERRAAADHVLPHPALRLVQSE